MISQAAVPPANPLLLLLHLWLVTGALAGTTSFTFVNNCVYTVWPGTLSGAGHASLSTTGFMLPPGQSATISAPPNWSGRFWGRTLCSTNSAGTFSCATGDCGCGRVDCSGSGATPPATLAEFTLNGDDAMDFYDVSLVDGYNLPMLVVPQQPGQGGGNCTSTGCVADLNEICPSDLLVLASVANGAGGQEEEEGVACQSACERYGSPQYCCSGAYGGPSTCRPTSYSQFFKNACPRAYSYAYDDSSSTFTCPTGAAYTLTFCPSTASQKSAGDNPAISNGTMVFISGEDVSAAVAPVSSVAVLIAVAAVAVSFTLLRCCL